MTIKVRVEGLDELKRAMSNLGDRIDGVVEDAIEDAVLGVRTSVIDDLARGGTGRTYELYDPRRTHTASAPGEPPVTDTGRLAGSVYTEIRAMNATVGSRLAYAAHLEYGTRTIGARPMWRPAADEAADQLRKDVIDGIRKVL